MDTYYGYKLPKAMHKEFADIIQKISEKQGEVSPQQIMDEFSRNYLDVRAPFEFVKVKIEDVDKDTKAVLDFKYKGKDMSIEALGNGPIDSVKNAINKIVDIDVKIIDYTEHALGEGSNAKAAAYIQMVNNKNGEVTFGVGVSSNITRASIRGLFSAINRLHADE